MMREKNEQDYFTSFIKSAIIDLNNNGVCYAYDMKQVEEIKSKIKKEVIVKEINCGIKKGYSIALK